MFAATPGSRASLSAFPALIPSLRPPNSGPNLGLGRDLPSSFLRCPIAAPSPPFPKSASYPPWLMKSPPNSTLKRLRGVSSPVRGSPPASDPEISLPIPRSGLDPSLLPQKGGREGKTPPRTGRGSRTSPDVPPLPPEPRSPHPCLKFVFSNASCSIILVHSPLQPYLSSSPLSSPSHSI